VNVRGVEIRVVRGSTEPELREGPHAPADEHAVRCECARRLEEAQRGKKPSVALPALGIGGVGLTPVAAGKIMVQEAIRVARAGASDLREILFIYPPAEGYEDFEKAVTGYVRHFLDALIWGPFVTVDAIIETQGGIVLIERSNPPFGFALPGGFVDYGESLEAAVAREAREETGLELRDLRQFHTYSEPARDPRFHTVTTVFSARADGPPKAGDDAAACRVVQSSEIDGLLFAFDHGQVLRDYLAARRG
jgi:ADP-ribose pyrophosphatase YjhB (NUDIX family)